MTNTGREQPEQAPEAILKRPSEILRTRGWRDLAQIANDVRAHHGVRSQAEILLNERFSQLTQGERASLSRVAPRSLISKLRLVPDARVIAALLSNPRLIEEDVIAIAADVRTLPAALSEIANSALWKDRRAVKVELALNRACPLHGSLKALDELPPEDLDRIARNPGVSRLVRMGALRRLGGSEPHP